MNRNLSLLLALFLFLSTLCACAAKPAVTSTTEHVPPVATTIPIDTNGANSADTDVTSADSSPINDNKGVTPQVDPDKPILKSNSSPEPKVESRRSTSIKVATRIADIQSSSLAEISGITTTSDVNSLLWAINDSGNASALLAVGNDGGIVKTFRLAVKNRDWESLSKTHIDGDPYLIIGDTGDNLRHHPSYQLHFIKEPVIDLGSQQPRLTINNTVTFSFPDGQRNVEAMAASGDWVYLISKEPLSNGKPAPGKLYRLRIPKPLNNAQLQAQYLGDLKTRRSSVASRLAASLAGVDLDQATALAFSKNGNAAYVLTYRQVIRYTKTPAEDWSAALLQHGKVIRTHGLRQAEAMAMDENDVLWITSEKLPAPIWAVPDRRSFE